MLARFIVANLQAGFFPFNSKIMVDVAYMVSTSQTCKQAFSPSTEAHLA
jgi:hypothetical protein